jgi:AraC-like DNA-binding protein
MESKIYEWIEYKPHEALKKYIDIYWVSSTNSLYIPSPKKFFPDGCNELFANTGNNTLYLNETIAVKPGIIYLGGTLTQAVNFSGIPNSNFFGIRFKPGGFRIFFKFPIHEVTGQFTELQITELKFVFDQKDSITTKGRLDSFFLQRLNTTNERFLSIAQDLHLTTGKITVDNLAKRHDIGFRSLERLFKSNVGISPKELSKILRFQAVVKRLKTKTYNESFLDLAFELGYYDHAHLTNEIKRFTGLTPSQLRAYFHN